MAQDELQQGLVLPRLVFLLAYHRIRIPKIVARHLPGGQWLQELYKGVGSSDILMEQAGLLYKEGESLGVGSRDEAINIMGRLIYDSIDEVAISQADLMEVFAALRGMAGTQVVDYEEIRLDKKLKLRGIPKWDSGFTPLDLVTGGLYQGIIMFMGSPGVGKTTMMMTLMEELVLSEVASSVYFFQTEIPGQMMQGRLAPMTRRTKFRKQDLVICGHYTSDEILERLEEDPDPDRVVIFDSPDVTAGGSGDTKRFALEAAWLSLIKVKQKCKAVVVTTWPRRKDRVMTIQSAAEAWAKAWYSDIIIGMNQMGGGRMRFRVLKNRFGITGNAISFGYNLENITWDLSDADIEEDW
jgi:hypothetical protein